MKRFVVTAGIAAMLVGSTASADSVNVTGMSTGAGFKVDLALAGHAGNLSGTHAGNYRTWIDGNINRTFCVELVQSLGTGTFDLVNVEDAAVPGPPSPVGLEAAQAIYNLYAYARNFEGDRQFTGNSGSDLDKAFAAAFQLMIWEIVYDGDFLGDSSIDTTSLDLTAGDLTGTQHGGVSGTDWGNILGFFNDFINHFDSLIGAGKWNDAGSAGLRALTNEQFQDQLIIIPLPAPVWMGLAGLAGIAVIRRRRA